MKKSERGVLPPEEERNPILDEVCNNAIARWLEGLVQPSKYRGGLIHGTAGIPSKGSPDTSWCPIYNVKMKRRQKNGGVWYSHKTKDGWCRG